MYIIKALTKIHENWGEDADDFHLTYHIDIGPNEVNDASDLFSFDLISAKRLNSILDQGGIVVGRGYFIMNDFNIKVLESTIKRLIKKCEDSDSEKTYTNLSKYFRWEMDE